MPANVVAGFLTGEKEQKSERFEIRFSENQMAALRYMSDEYGISPSEMVRRAVFAPSRLAQSITRGEWRAAGDYVSYRKAAVAIKDELFRTHQSLARVGNNVNQVARKLNRGARPAGGELKAFAEEFAALREQLEAIEKKVDRLLVSYESLGPFEDQ